MLIKFIGVRLNSIFAVTVRNTVVHKQFCKKGVTIRYALFLYLYHMKKDVIVNG